MLGKQVWAVVFSATLFVVVVLSIYFRTHPSLLPNLFATTPTAPDYKLGSFYAEDASGTQEIMAISDFLRKQDGVVYVKVESNDLFVVKFDQNEFNWRNAWRTIRYNDWARVSQSDFVVMD